MPSAVTTPDKSGRQGLLLVGHGSREAVGVEEFLVVARQVAAARTEWLVEPCFLEFAEPSIAAGMAALAARGARSVVVVPVILFAAGHIRRDIPVAVAAAAARHPQLVVRQAEHLGCHEALVLLSEKRFAETAREDRGAPAAETQLVLVGRGSLDPDATAEMLRFAEARRARAKLAAVTVGFLSMAAPTLSAALSAAAISNPRRVVVQPHLLFGGVLLKRLTDVVGSVAEQHPRIEWCISPHLGADPLLVQALVARAGQALNSDQGEVVPLR